APFVAAPFLASTSSATATRAARSALAPVLPLSLWSLTLPTSRWLVDEGDAVQSAMPRAESSSDSRSRTRATSRPRGAGASTATTTKGPAGMHGGEPALLIVVGFAAALGSLANAPSASARPAPARARGRFIGRHTKAARSPRTRRPDNA